MSVVRGLLVRYQGFSLCLRRRSNRYVNVSVCFIGVVFISLHGLVGVNRLHFDLGRPNVVIGRHVNALFVVVFVVGLPGSLFGSVLRYRGSQYAPRFVRGGNGVGLVYLGVAWGVVSRFDFQRGVHQASR